ncbi:hypothetical protein [Paenibacillus kribbensis]|uniref:hypothetical protein n=1 Tax=Paenibacillus kribbensis TaxID=172713 RepID=UPI0008395158|nr:hypothetical protein [Paenibacillus kribbensis]
MWSIIGLALIVGITIAIWQSVNSAKEKKQIMNEENAIALSKMFHVEGLPIAEKTACTILLKQDRILVKAGGAEFNVAINQITAAEVKTDVEIANIVSSSAVKGIAGGLLFGPIGLVVGARAKNKEKKTYNYYFILNYINSEGNLSSLLFDSGSNHFSAMQIKNKLDPLLQNNGVRQVNL